ncbi:unnamed protein product [Darwinula stevensoni]|uniref:Ribosome-recycling factor, mitochondrial n=1 Tax=Darwinula stevensoni TaxID=69355 RepID=A0A7R9A2B3_9CRUS|nr:unnamed protein product [Darwinula stevensoni]CAG0888389.1 unnamed protein product [Darwinula stevensoni]
MPGVPLLVMSRCGKFVQRGIPLVIRRLRYFQNPDYGAQLIKPCAFGIKNYSVRVLSDGCLGSPQANRSMPSCNIHLSPHLAAKGKDKGKDGKGKKTIAISEEEMSSVIDVDRYKKALSQTLDAMKHSYVEQVSLRTSIGSIESLTVELEGDTFPLSEVAQLVKKSPQLYIINVSSFPQAAPSVMKAIQESGMNLNAQQEGTTIYLPVPKVTKEHRERLAKNAKIMFNKCKEDIRNIQNRYVKDSKKKGDEVSEDVVFSVQNQIMAMAEKYADIAEELYHSKVEELLNPKM